MRSKFGWNRPPLADSIRLRTYSRSRKAKNTGVIAPSCTPTSPRNSDTLAMRLISIMIVRIHCARGGASIAHQLLGGEDERHLVGEAAEPVDAVDERRDLRVRADLGELLVAAVHVAGRRVGPHDLLAVEADDDPQRAVRRRVLRTDVEGHPLGLELDVEARVGGLGGDVAELLAVDRGRSRRRSALRRGSASPRRRPSPVARPARRAAARRRRCRATASPSGRAAGSPCAADSPRTRTAGRCCAGRGGRRSVMPNSSWHWRSCQFAPAYTGTQLSIDGVVVGRRRPSA